MKILFDTFFLLFASLGLALIIRFWLIPMFRKKIGLRIMSWKLKRMSKKYDGDTAEKLKEISRLISQYSKSNEEGDD